MQGPMQFRPLKEKVAWLLINGEKEMKLQPDFNRIQKQLEKFHPATDKTGAQRPSGLVVLNLPSKLQGDSLLTKNGEAAEDQIVKFLDKYIAGAEPPWINRRNRLP